MATYTVDLTPALRCEGTEGSLDTSIVNGVSLARNLSMVLVKNGSDYKMVKAADGGTFTDSVAGLTSLPGISITSS